MVRCENTSLILNVAKPPRCASCCDRTDAFGDCQYRIPACPGTGDIAVAMYAPNGLSRCRRAGSSSRVRTGLFSPRHRQRWTPSAVTSQPVVSLPKPRLSYVGAQVCECEIMPSETVPHLCWIPAANVMMRCVSMRRECFSIPVARRCGDCGVRDASSPPRLPVVRSGRHEQRQSHMG